MRRDIIIGAGLIGLFTAWELTRAGRQVLVLERNRVASGTTGKTFAWLNGTSKTDPAYHRLNAAGLKRHHELARQWGEHTTGFCGTGAILWAEPDAPLWPEPGIGDGIAALAAHHEALCALDYPSVWLERQSLCALEPRVAFGDHVAGILAPGDRWMETGRLAQHLANEIVRLGGEIREDAPVTGFEQDTGGRISAVITSSVPYEAESVVLTAGPWTAEVVALIHGASNAAFPVGRVPGLLVTTPPDQVRDFIRHVLYAPDPGDFHIRPTAQGGLMLGSDGIDEAIDETASADMLWEAARALLERGRRYLPDLPVEDLYPGVQRQVGIRPMPRDDRTIAGPLPGVPGCFVIATHSGITLAPLLGDLIAEEIETGVVSPMLADFRPGRFT